MSNELITSDSYDKIIVEFLYNFNSEQTRRAYLNDLQDFFTFRTFPTPSSIQLIHLIEYRDQLTKQDKAAATIRRKIASIKSFLDWCVGRELLRSNPAAGLKLPRTITRYPTLAFTDEEVELMIKAPNTATQLGRLHRAIITLLFSLGLRRSELVNVSKTDVFEDRGVKLLRVKGKGGKERLIPLTNTAYAALNDYMSNSTKPMNPSSIYRIISRYAKLVGISKRVGAHSCRATMISHLLENQVSPRDVADLAGHASINTTVGIYDKKRDMMKNSAAYKVKFGL